MVTAEKRMMSFHNSCEISYLYDYVITIEVNTSIYLHTQKKRRKMLTRSFFALFIVVLQQNALGLFLGCNVCDRLLTYNYIITADIVPVDLLRGCAFKMSQRSCSIDVQFDFDNRKTIINVTSSHEYVETSIIAVTSIENGIKHKSHVSF
jgi:hypothetical protein